MTSQFRVEFTAAFAVPFTDILWIIRSLRVMLSIFAPIFFCWFVMMSLVFSWWPHTKPDSAHMLIPSILISILIGLSTQINFRLQRFSVIGRLFSIFFSEVDCWMKRFGLGRCIICCIRLHHWETGLMFESCNWKRCFR